MVRFARPGFPCAAVHVFDTDVSFMDFVIGLRRRLTRGRTSFAEYLRVLSHAHACFNKSHDAFSFFLICVIMSLYGQAWLCPSITPLFDWSVC